MSFSFHFLHWSLPSITGPLSGHLATQSLFCHFISLPLPIGQASISSHSILLRWFHFFIIVSRRIVRHIGSSYQWCRFISSPPHMLHTRCLSLLVHINTVCSLPSLICYVTATTLITDNYYMSWANTLHRFDIFHYCSPSPSRHHYYHAQAINTTTFSHATLVSFSLRIIAFHASGCLYAAHCRSLIACSPGLRAGQ